MMQLSLVLACIISTVTAFIGNAVAVKKVGSTAVCWLVPPIEELAKTLSAIAFGAPIMFTHIAFAAVEAVYDLSRGTEGGRLGAAISLVGHTAFGAVTVLVWKATGLVWLGITASIGIHFIWNIMAMRVRIRRV